MTTHFAEAGIFTVTSKELQDLLTFSLKSLYRDYIAFVSVKHTDTEEHKD